MIQQPKPRFRAGPVIAFPVMALAGLLVLMGVTACRGIPLKDGYYSCDPGVAGSCPSGMTCRWSHEIGDYRCFAGAPPDAYIPVCGNGTIDQGEQCDGQDLGGQTCEGLGHPGGTLACSAICTFDRSGCDPPVTCGDGDIDPPAEQCDGSDLGGNDCEDLGFTGGALACRTNCAFDTSGCVDCVDDDGDGRDGYDATVCPSGDDFCDSDPNNWTPTGCASCVDNDGDGRGSDCDMGTDCDDGNPAIWSGCAGCTDSDGDGYDAVDPVNCPTGDDNCDDDPHNWTPTGCASCADNDGDGRGSDCDMGTDCDDNDPGIWTGCVVCGDAVCDPTESVSGCPADCYCGNSTCDQGETSGSCPGDCPPTCVDPVCDFWPQCGCGTGLKCTVLSGNRACGQAGAGTPGTVCTADNQCMVGTLCASNNGGAARCIQFCNVHSDCLGGPGSLCAFQVTYGGNPIPGANACSVHCDPVDPSIHCPVGWTCHPYLDPNNDTFTDCTDRAGTSTTSCNQTDIFCAPGYNCSNGQCYHYCRKGYNDCPGGMSCDSFSPPAMVGSIEYGVCR